MKIKLAYPKIPDTLYCPLKQCIAFEKYDGTNMHWVWNPKDSFIGFGTRRDRFPANWKGNLDFKQAHPELEEILFDDGIGEFLKKLDNYLTTKEKYSSANEIIIFTEFLGDNSFAGSHSAKDKKKLVLFDVEVNGKFISPEQLVEDFKDHNLAKVVFKGKFSGQLFIDVRKGRYYVKEGVVVKGLVGDEIYMAKIKTEAYMERLKEQFTDKWKDYWE